MSATTLTQIPNAVYNVDPSHSSVGFEVKHMGIATVRGRFGAFEGTIDATGDAPVLQGNVDVSTVDTGDANRDGHLKGPEFFDADQQPQISFSSTATEVSADGEITLQGEITIKGITKPIELTGQVAENGEDPWGNERIGLELTSAIDRREFELKWNQTLPNGNLLVANDVKLLVSVSAVKSA
ncbi:MAG TPA: YceI family protein [Solirubrobacteraceae bacterium]|jgi:polyisoprenoid-binding protein YceI|nr:YceI family protein [Solirubrobacteraceae bacterium]